MITNGAVASLLSSIKENLENNKVVVAYHKVEELERYLAYLGTQDTKKSKKPKLFTMAEITKAGKLPDEYKK